ncbi:LysR family transcriptional regulator [Kordiimonas aquimaris]|uniref:LysR family transcriptional regulator n=1 Tax=Kordiimonas aquimaris TaxID=707591 RepID=UPI0021CDFF17|nr:LysR family transcriptional regulator [Kordiimonas aquimaris]
MHNVKLIPSLLVFAEVAQRGSFTKAAVYLGLSKSAVSQHIKRLEAHVGSQLLARNTRGMALTTVGVRLFERSQALTRQASSALKGIDADRVEPKGKFSVTFPSLLEKGVALPALRQLSVEFPGLSLCLRVTEQPLDLIEEKLDVAIYAGTPKDSDYRLLPLGSIQDMFYASPLYIDNYGAPLSPSDLSGHQWIAPTWHKSPLLLYAAGSPIDAVPTHEVALDAFVTCDAMASSIEMTRKSFGVCLLPEIAARPLMERGELKHILPGYRGQVWPFSFIHAFKAQKPVHVTRFYELLRTQFARVLVEKHIL